MLPHQKYPSVYRGYPQDGMAPPLPPPPSSIPQSPFDVAYGSSLLPRQLLVSSPFVQVASPLPSPVHSSYSHAHIHPQAQYYQRSNSHVSSNLYYNAPPPPKLHLQLPPKRSQRDTPSKMKPRSRSQHENSVVTRDSNTVDSSENSSIDGTSSVLEFNHSSSGTNGIIPEHLKSSSSTSLSQLYTSTNSSSLSNASSQQSNYQFSKSPTRSIILTNVNPSLSITKLLDFINFGPIENVRIVENHPKEGSSSVVLSFLKVDTCLNFFNNVLTYLAKFQKLIHSPRLSIAFIHSKKILPFISNAISNDGATRNVYVGNLNGLEHPVDEEFLRSEFLKFGLIDKIDLLEKPLKELQEDGTENVGVEKYAFIHFTSIASAIKAVEQLNLNPTWQDAKIFYGTDRCSLQKDSLMRSVIDEEVTEDDESNQDDNESDYNSNLRFFPGSEADELVYDNGSRSVQYLYPEQMAPRFESFSSRSHASVQQQYQNILEAEEAIQQNNHTAALLASKIGGSENVGNRTICLINLDSMTKVEDICNVVRGGIVQTINYLPEKRICFITFIEPVAAAQFYANTQLSPITLHGRKLKIGWGSHSGPLPTQIALAVTVGASRNVYIGDDGESDDSAEGGSRVLPTEEELREDFGKFGELEQVNFFRNEHCVFLNFLNISNAIKVVTDANGSKSDDFHAYFNNKYRGLKISYGKDRCGNPPKARKKKRKSKFKKAPLETRTKKVVEGEESDGKTEGLEVEEVPIELFASMGISKKETVPMTPIKQLAPSSSATIDAFGITNNSEAPVTEEETEDAASSVSTSFDILVDGPTDTSKTSPKQSPRTTDTQSHSTNQESSVELPKPYNPRRVTNTTLNHKRQNSQLFNSRNSSRISSQASLSSLYEQHAYNDDYHHSIPFAPPALSRGSSRSNLSTYQMHPSQAQFNNNYGNHYNTTSGLQVMAQYLQQSQHANILYAANILNAVDDPMNNGYAYQKRGARRNSKRQ